MFTPIRCSHAFIPFLFVSALLSLPFARGDEKDPTKNAVLDLKELAREASRAAKTQLVSGEGTALFEFYRQLPGQAKPELLTKANCTIQFDQGKYNIHLEYTVDRQLVNDSQTIVYDGKTIVTNDLGKRMRPHGMEGEIFSVNNPFAAPLSARFPFNPTRLPRHVMDVEEVIKRYGNKITMNSLPSGKIEASFENGEAIYRFEVLPSNGYNIAQSSVFNKNISATVPC